MARLLLGFLLAASLASAAPTTISPRVKVDQLGWEPGETKRIVLDAAMQGFDAPAPLTPGATLEILRWSDDAVVLTVPLASWRGGVTNAQSGNRAWIADVSSLTTPGSYYAREPGSGACSGRFEISNDAHRALLRDALRTFYYQRCGVAKDAAHAGASWADAACHLGPQQDRDCRPVWDPTLPGRDLSGGWHDAGDYNKYVNFTDDPVHELLAAYEQYPQAFGDDFGIPESGNGVPDVLDEVRFELEWFLKMQLPDGSVLLKLAVTDYTALSPPSTDPGPRRHAPPTASATISACGAFAHGAIVFGARGDASSQAFSATLRAAALSAWAWLEANPGLIPSNYDNAGFVNASAEDPPYEQAANRTCAAAYLLVLTGDTRFRDFFDAGYDAVHLMQWGYAYPFETSFQDGLLYYQRSPLATPAVVTAIRDAFAASMHDDNLVHVTAGDDPYSAWLADGDYTWGSNWTKSKQGGMYLAMLAYGMDAANAAAYRDAAGGYLHSLCGVNPLGITYFSNLAADGAEKSVRSFYHSWFADGTQWDEVGTSAIGPPPGFMPGGPNPSFQPDPSYGGPPLEPPMNQPIQKSFLDWNGGWPEDSWEVTENQCAYQGAAVKLIAAFVPGCTAPGSPGSSLRVTKPAALLSWTPGAGSDSTDVLRCDASSSPCTLATWRNTSAASELDAAPPERVVWYSVVARNACGTTE